MKALTVKSCVVAGDGSVRIGYQRGANTQIQTTTFQSKKDIKALYQELDDRLELPLLVMLIALYVKASGDATLSNASTGLIDKQITFDISAANTVDFA